ncbi:MAG: translocation/assembly module TamB domain-containing protein [Nitrospirae bacterium]|nr:translocation/assembly module TamB domain-containing protein [Nitrospirota bacterium]
MTPDEPSHPPETASLPDPPAPAPRRRALRWVVISALFATLLLLGLFIAQAKLTQIASRSIQTALSAQLGLPVSITQLSLHWFPASVTLAELRIGSPDQEPAPLLSTTSVEVRFSLLSLLADRFIIHRIDLESPRLELTPSRIDRLSRHARSADKTGPVIIRQVTLHDGALRYTDPERNRLAVIDRVDGNLDFGLLTEQTTLHLTDGRLLLEQGAWRQTFTSIVGQATWTPKRVTIREVKVDGPEGRFALDGAVALEAPPILQLTVKASMPLGRLALWLPADHSWDGLLDLEAAIKGPWTIGKDLWHTVAPLSLNGRLDVTNVMIDAVPIGAASTQWQLNQGRLLLTRLTGSALKGSLTGRASLSLPPIPPAIEASIDLSELQAGPLVRRWFPVAGFPDGRVTGHLAVHGAGWTVDDWGGNGRLAFVAMEPDHPAAPPPPAQPVPLREAWPHLSRLIVEGQWHATQITLHHAEIVSRKDNRLTVEGSADYHGPLELSGAWQLTDLGEIGDWAMASGIHGLDGWTGSVTGQTTLTGSWDHPRLAGSAATQTLQRHAEIIDEIHAAFSYEAGTFTLRDGRVRQRAGHAVVGGAITLAAPPSTSSPPDQSTHPRFRLSMTVTDGELGRILHLFGIALPVDGRAAGTLTLTGTPADFHLRGPVRVAEGRLFGQPIAGSNAILDVTLHGITLSRVRLTEGDGTLNGSARIGFDGSYQADLAVETVSLERIERLHTAAPQVSGILSGALSGSGTWKEPHAEARIGLSALAVGPTALGRGTVTLRLAGDRLDVAAELDDPRLSVEGVVQVRNDLPAEFRLRVTRFPFALLLRPFVPAWPEQITLTASGEGELTGSLVHPANLSGRLSFSELTVRLVDYPITNDGPIEFVLQNGRVTAQRVRLTGEGTILAAEGGLTLFERYDLFVHGEADLAILRLFVPGVSYGKGKAYLALQITDRWLDPGMAGGISIQNGQIRLETVDQPLTISYAGLVFDSQQLVLDDLHGGVGKGTVQASGRIGLHGLHPAEYRVLMEVSRLQIAPIEGLSGLVDGSLWLQGEWPAPDVAGIGHHLLKGDLQLVRATYVKRIDLKTILKEQPGFNAVTLSLPSFLNTVALQVHLSGREAIWIRNNIATLPLDIDLEARGTVEHPVIIGRIFTTGGTFTFLHTPFQVSQGSIDFLDPKQTRPALDLKASAKVRDYVIDLALTGTPERIGLELSSDPALSQADILSVMTVGRTSEEVGTVGAGAVATNEAAALLVSELLEEPAQQIGIDRFQIDSVVDQSGLTVGPQLTIGKQFLDNRLLFLYSQPLDPTTVPVYKLEYEINRHMSLVGEGDDTGRFGGDVKFRFEFR